MKTTESIWRSLTEIENYEPLGTDSNTVVAVIGGGITGITLSKFLGDRGISNVVLESGNIGASTTSQSTGNLYATIDSGLASLKSKYDAETVKKVVGSRQQALNQIEQFVEKLGISCDFKRVPMFIYSSDEINADKISKEKEVADNTFIETSIPDHKQFFYPVTNVVKMEEQAQINPMSYLQGLAKSVNSKSSKIYEHSGVQSVSKENGTFILQTSRGKVTAEMVVHATHTPKGIQLVQTLLGPYREYGIACRLQNVNNKLPEGIFWGYHGKSKKISSRIYKKDEDIFLIVVGEPHKVGVKKNNESCFRELQNFAGQYFDVEEPEYYWGGQHYRPADLLPYIGPNQKESNEYIATGYSTDGLVYGTLAAQIISDMIAGNKNSYSDLYRANRKQPVKSASNFVKENIGVVKHLMKSVLPSSEDFKSMPEGEGKVISHKGKKLGVSRDDNGKLNVVTAICSHMGCTVEWNHAEKSWDCPCHGSRFNSRGEVLEGPAFNGLKDYEI